MTSMALRLKNRPNLRVITHCSPLALLIRRRNLACAASQPKKQNQRPDNNAESSARPSSKKIHRFVN